MRRKYLVWLIMICAMLCVYGCGSPNGPEDVVAKVDGYNMTIDDFNIEIEHSSHVARRYKELEELLDIAIRKQILIQEAQRQGLDREESFMQTIERYWEQALIKELLDKQIEKMTDSSSRRERTMALDKWVDELYKKSDIKINKDALEKMKKDGDR